MIYSEEFLMKCMRQLKADAVWHGSGPNRYDIDKVSLTIYTYENRKSSPQYEKWFNQYKEYWLDNENLLKYRKQLSSLFYQEEYRNKSQGY